MRTVVRLFACGLLAVAAPAISAPRDAFTPYLIAEQRAQTALECGLIDDLTYGAIIDVLNDRLAWDAAALQARRASPRRSGLPTVHECRAMRGY